MNVPAPTLSSKQRSFLRGLGHTLNPVVLLGKEGLSDGVVAQVNEQLTRHELVKLKLGPGADVDRHEAADELATRTGSALVQVIGKMVLLYRQNPEESVVDLPTPAKDKAKRKAASKKQGEIDRARAKVKAKKAKKKTKTQAKQRAARGG